MINLQYFLFTSTIDELRQEKMDELFQYFYYELQSLLTRLDYDMKKFPTLHEFQMQAQKKYFYGELNEKNLYGIVWKVDQ